MIIHFRHILIILLSVFIAAGCTVWSDYEPEVLSELSISVVVSDTPGAPLTKSAGTKVQVNPEDYVNPAHNGEKMQTLRVVIVREDGTVEMYNYYIQNTVIAFPRFSIPSQLNSYSEQPNKAN